MASSYVVVREIHSIPDRHNPLIPGQPFILLRLGRAGYQKEAVLTMRAAETIRDRLAEEIGPRVTAQPETIRPARLEGKDPASGKKDSAWALVSRANQTVLEYTRLEKENVRKSQ